MPELHEEDPQRVPVQAVHQGAEEETLGLNDTARPPDTIPGPGASFVVVGLARCPNSLTRVSGDSNPRTFAWSTIDLWVAACICPGASRLMLSAGALPIELRVHEGGAVFFEDPAGYEPATSGTWPGTDLAGHGDDDEAGAKRRGRP